MTDQTHNPNRCVLCNHSLNDHQWGTMDNDGGVYCAGCPQPDRICASQGGPPRKARVVE